MAKRLWKIAGTNGSDGINSCPTVIGVEDDAVTLQEDGKDVILQGYDLDAETRALLGIPAGENAIRMPKELYLRGARRLMEGE